MATTKLNADVLVISDASQKSAARTLHGAGLDVVVVERRERVGSRIFTRRQEGATPMPIELGAEFIHGSASQLTRASTVVQFTVGNILEPRLMGKGLNLSPVIMLLGLAVWGTIWGIVGMFLAVPLMVVSMIVFSQFAATRPVALLMLADGELRG